MLGPSLRLLKAALSPWAPPPGHAFITHNGVVVSSDGAPVTRRIG